MMDVYVIRLTGHINVKVFSFYLNKDVCNHIKQFGLCCKLPQCNTDEIDIFTVSLSPLYITCVHHDDNTKRDGIRQHNWLAYLYGHYGTVLLLRHCYYCLLPTAFLLYNHHLLPHLLFCHCLSCHLSVCLLVLLVLFLPLPSTFSLHVQFNHLQPSPTPPACD